MRGEFLNYFNQHGGLRILGYPITEEFALNGRTVQYFQRAGWNCIQKDQRGSGCNWGRWARNWVRRRRPRRRLAPILTYQRYYPETGHTVAYAFLNFFDANGGVATFGYPISDYGPENGKGRIVQYFQRGKLEWYPELAPEQRVQLADLGTIHFDLTGRAGPARSGLKKPVPPPGKIGDVPLALKVSATTKYAITSRRFDQMLYVYVTDQKNAPLQDAEVLFTVRDATGVKPTPCPRPTPMGSLLTALMLARFGRLKRSLSK